jgi:tetratricopeptide (TPR) repeat protein
MESTEKPGPSERVPLNKNSFLDEWAEPTVFAGLALACIFIYGQTIRFDFINLDDHSYVYLNEVVLSGVNSRSIAWAFTAFHSSNWHPLTWLSHALDVQLFGLNAGAHHAVNVVLHLSNACLAFIVFRSYTGALWKSAIVALLFAVHPAHVESVAWISERKDVLSTLFWLLTMLAYVRYAKGVDEGSGPFARFVSPYFVLTFALFGIGLLAKPMLVTLPFVLLLLDIWPLKRIETARDSGHLFAEKIPLFVLAAASSVVTFLAQTSSGAVLGLETYPIGSRILNSVVAYVKYVFVMFYPADLGVWYPFDPRIGVPVFIASLIGVIAMTAIAIRQIRRRPYIALGWFWFLGTLVPVIGLVQVGAQSMADRYTYIPYFGLFIIVVWGGAELFEKFKIDLRAAVALALTAAAALAFVAYGQASYWRNSETLYTRTLAVTKENYFMMNLLCRHYIDRTPTENAERRCTELLDKTSNYLEAHNTIGLLRVELGRYDDALKSYRKALAIKPNTGIVYSNMAVAFSKKGDTDQAEQHLARAVELADRSLSREALAYSYNVLGEAYAAKKDPIKARSAFETALRYDSELEPARQNLENLQGAE